MVWANDIDDNLLIWENDIDDNLLIYMPIWTIDGDPLQKFSSHEINFSIKDYSVINLRRTLKTFLDKTDDFIVVAI